MTKTTGRQDGDFLDRLFGAVSDEDIARAIRNLLSGDSSWVLDWVEENFLPEDVFDDNSLSSWAENNGYEKKEE